MAQVSPVIRKCVRKVVSIVVSLSTVATVILVSSVFLLGILTPFVAGVRVTQGLTLGLVAALSVVAIIFMLKQTRAQSEQLRKIQELSRIDDGIKQLRRDHIEAQKKGKELLNKLFYRYAHTIYAEIEAYHNIDKKINLKHPLPSMSGWAATPDLISKIIDLIQDNKIKTVVDLGSGVSTIAAGYALSNTQGGKVISLDHDKEYMEYTRAAIDKHGLSDVVDLRHAPLERQKLNGEQCIWYSQKVLAGVDKVDLLIVDGPPQSTQSRARFPALPVLYGSLSKKAIVVVDDYARKDESSMVDLWMGAYPEFKRIEVKGLKGMAILSR